MDGIGDEFQRQTRYRRGVLPGGRLDWAAQPDPYKVYPDAPRVPLPPPPSGAGERGLKSEAGAAGRAEGAATGPGGEGSLWRALRARHSGRAYGGAPLTLSELGALVWAAGGISRVSGGFPYRTAPSAGGLYPIETYLVAHRVEGLEPGAYHYAVLERALERLRAGDLRMPVARAALDQSIAADAAAVFVWTSIWGRSTWKYGQRAYRYVPLDAGHIAENVALAAVGLGLGACQIAAFYDPEANALLGLDGTDESVIYMTVVGRPA